MSKQVSYKLIDKEGLLEHNYLNEDVVALHKSGTFTGVIDEQGSLHLKVPEGFFITVVELSKFFEEVKQELVSHLWDGKETLEVGMVVKINSYKADVLFVMPEEEQALIKRIVGGGNKLVHVSKLERMKPTHKEETFKKVMCGWKLQSLDTAHDDPSSRYSIESVFNAVYEVMKGKPSLASHDSEGEK